MTTEAPKLVGRTEGQIIHRRVVDGDGRGPKTEATFEEEGQLNGVAVETIGTFTAERRPDGTLRGRGQGLVRTPDQQQVPWRATGVGQVEPGGATGWKITVHLEPSATKLDHVAKAPLLVAFQVGPEGRTRARYSLWEG